MRSPATKIDHPLPAKFVRLLVTRRERVPLATLSERVSKIFADVRALDPRFDTFSAFDGGYGFVPTRTAIEVKRALGVGERDDPETERRPSEPTHETRFVNREDGARFCDLVVAAIDAGPIQGPAVQVELRSGIDPTWKEQWTTMHRLFAALVTGLDADAARATRSDESQGEHASVGWLTFVGPDVVRALPPLPGVARVVRELEGGAKGAIIATLPGDPFQPTERDARAALAASLRSRRAVEPPAPPPSAPVAAPPLAVPTYQRAPIEVAPASPRPVVQPMRPPPTYRAQPYGAVPAIASEHVSAAAVVWSIGTPRGAARYLTAIVKVTYHLTDQGVLSLAPPEPLVCADEYVGVGNATSSMKIGADLAPLRRQAEVVLVGHARVPREGATLQLAVVNGLGRETLVHKRVNVVPRSDHMVDPRGLHIVPLTYEEALMTRANPVGREHPSLSTPTQVDECFGPISSYWEARSKLLRPGDRQALREPSMALAEGFQDAFFQQAPIDQRSRAPFLGSERIVLDGFEGATRRDVRLPGWSPIALVSFPNRPPTPLMLAGDTLHVDLDRRLVTLTSRRHVELEPSIAAGDIVVAGALHQRELTWPNEAALEAARRSFAAPASKPAAALDGTLALSEGTPASALLPFGPAGPITPRSVPNPASRPPWLEASGKPPSVPIGESTVDFQPNSSRKPPTR